MSIRFAAAAHADIVARCQMPTAACRHPANDNGPLARSAGDAIIRFPAGLTSAAAGGGTSVSRC